MCFIKPKAARAPLSDLSVSQLKSLLAAGSDPNGANPSSSLPSEPVGNKAQKEELILGNKEGLLISGPFSFPNDNCPSTQSFEGFEPIPSCCGHSRSLSSPMVPSVKRLSSIAERRSSSAPPNSSSTASRWKSRKPLALQIVVPTEDVVNTEDLTEERYSTDDVDALFQDATICIERNSAPPVAIFVTGALRF